MFSHDDKECEIWLKSKGALKVEQQQFGHWIRVNPFNLNRSRSIEIKGFEPRQSRSWGVTEQSEEVVFEHRSQSGENEDPSGGEENHVRLNLINHFIDFIPCQTCLYFSI